MRRRDEAIPFALGPRPKLSPHPPGREHGATGWGEKRQKNAADFFIAGAVVRSGCRGAALTSLFWLHDEGRCYKTHLVPSLAPLSRRTLRRAGVLWSVTPWRFNKTYPVPPLGIGVRASFVQKNSGVKDR